MLLHRAMAEALRHSGADVLFGVLGDANMFLVDSYARIDGSRYVAATEEKNAVLMATGWARRTGRVGVATVTHGPGVTNALTALVDAVRGETPLLVVAGDTPPTDVQNLQDIDQGPLIRGTGAGHEPVHSAASAVADLARAYARARRERRPVVLTVPSDLMGQDVSEEPPPRAVPRSPASTADSAAVEEAVGVLAGARRPVILAGRGAVRPEAREALVELAARTGALLATTLLAKDLFAGEPNDLGVCGTVGRSTAADEVAASDCVIAFGAGLNRWTTVDGTLFAGKPVIQVDHDFSRSSRYVRPSVAVVGDAAFVARRMRELLDLAEVAAPPPRVAARPETVAVSAGYGLRSVIGLLDRALPDRRTLVCDGGRFMIESLQGLRVPEPSAYVHTLNFGSIGLGLANAVGAAVARPEMPTLLVVGDGGFALGGWGELWTAVRLELDIVVAVLNDGAYGAEHVVFRERGLDPGITLFAWPDFAAIARAHGGRGMVVHGSEDFEAAEALLAGHAGPRLLDFRLDPDRIERGA